MQDMFYKAVSFNDNLGRWDVSRVVQMQYMFSQAKLFDQDLSRWTLSHSLSNMRSMFFASSKLSDCNKAALRTAWGNTQKNVAFLKHYAHWSGTCSRTGIACRAWQKPGTGQNPKCEPALWLDGRSCMANVWNGTHNLGQAANNVAANNTVRSNWATPFLDHVPDQISITNGACTYLPNFSEVLSRSFDSVATLLAGHLAARFTFGDTIEHNAGDGLSALVEFEEGSSDLFTINFRANSNDGSCTNTRALEVGDGINRVPFSIRTATLSLRSVTRSENTLECHRIEIKLGTGQMSILDDLLAKSGRLPGEPSFAISRFSPNAAQSPKLPPTIKCPTKASLAWPFELKAMVGPDLEPSKDHEFKVCGVAPFLNSLCTRLPHHHRLTTHVGALPV